MLRLMLGLARLDVYLANGQRCVTLPLALLVRRAEVSIEITVFRAGTA